MHDGAATLAAAGASSTTLAWFTLAGALGGVFLTSVFGLVVGLLNHRWQARAAEDSRLTDHDVRVRDERRSSYVEYWHAWNKLIQELRLVESQIRDPSPDDGDAGESRDLADDSNGRESMAASGTAAGISRRLADEVSTAELSWRTAADVLLLTARPEVASAAKDHIELTSQKIDAAWRGEHHVDPDGRTYERLNNAMQADLLSPPRPDQWKPQESNGTDGLGQQTAAESQAH